MTSTNNRLVAPGYSVRFQVNSVFFNNCKKYEIPSTGWCAIPIHYGKDFANYSNSNSLKRGGGQFLSNSNDIVPNKGVFRTLHTSEEVVPMNGFATIPSEYQIQCILRKPNFAGH